MKFPFFPVALSILGVFSFDLAFGAGPIPPPDKKKPVKPEKKMGITGTHASGDGCIPGSVTSQITPDNTQFTLIFNDYIVEKKENFLSAARSCSVRVNLDIPDGWMYTLVSAEFSGYYYLEAGVSASQKAQYHFTNGGKPSGTAQGKAESAFTGPADQSYFRTDFVPVRSGQWSPCAKGDRAIVINTALNVSGAMDGYGYISLDLMSAAIGQKQAQRYMIQWQPCLGGKFDVPPSKLK